MISALLIFEHDEQIIFLKTRNQRSIVELAEKLHPKPLYHQTLSNFFNLEFKDISAICLTT